MKTFYSAEDIENFAERGQREIRVDNNVVLTDMAKQTAHMLGIRITHASAGSAPSNFTPAGPRSPGRTRAFSGRPKGCQRRPANKSTTASGPSAGRSNQVVDQLVEKIKRIKDAG
jgi:hypothetical protein